MTPLDDTTQTVGCIHVTSQTLLVTF